jgi:hypothetical protein
MTKPEEHKGLPNSRRLGLMSKIGKGFAQKIGP